MMHELRMCVSSDVHLGVVLGRHPKINLFGLHYCVICCEVETKSAMFQHLTRRRIQGSHVISAGTKYNLTALHS